MTRARRRVVPRRVEPVGSAALFVLLSIVDLYEDGQRPTFDALEDLTGLSRSTIHKHIETLKNERLVERRGTGQATLVPLVTRPLICRCGSHDIDVHLEPA